MKQIFNKDGFLIILKRDKHEPYEHFLERGNFVVSQLPKNDAEFEQALVYSRIFLNVKYNRSKYGKEVMDNLHSRILLTTRI